MAAVTKPTLRDRTKPTRAKRQVKLATNRTRDLAPSEIAWLVRKRSEGVPTPSQAMIEIAKSFKEFMSTPSDK